MDVVIRLIIDVWRWRCSSICKGLMCSDLIGSNEWGGKLLWARRGVAFVGVPADRDLSAALH